jgi:hypothetical protein
MNDRAHDMKPTRFRTWRKKARFEENLTLYRVLKVVLTTMNAFSDYLS